MNDKNKKILFVASKAAPYIKSGGLGDVIGSLPEAVSCDGYEGSVMIPKLPRRNFVGVSE